MHTHKLVKKGHLIVEKGEIPLFLMLVPLAPLIPDEEAGPLSLSCFEGPSFLTRSVTPEISHCDMVTDGPRPSLSVHTVNTPLTGYGQPGKSGMFSWSFAYRILPNGPILILQGAAFGLFVHRCPFPRCTTVVQTSAQYCNVN